MILLLLAVIILTMWSHGRKHKRQIALTHELLLATARPEYLILRAKRRQRNRKVAFVILTVIILSFVCIGEYQ